MTSDQIKAVQIGQLSDSAWLKEIALQIALLNEKPVAIAPTPAPTPQKHPQQFSRK